MDSGISKQVGPNDASENGKITKESLDAVIKKTVNENAKNLDEKQKEDLEEVFHKIVYQGMVPKDAMKMSDEVMNICYSYAYNLYNTGKFEEAKKVFTIMTLFDPQSAKYMFALGACLHKQKEFKKAIEAYFTCAVLDRVTPIPYYHISDCFLQLDNSVGADLALKAAVKRCSEDPVYAKIKAKCYAMLTGLRKAAEVAKED